NPPPTIDTLRQAYAALGAPPPAAAAPAAAPPTAAARTLPAAAGAAATVRARPAAAAAAAMQAIALLWLRWLRMTAVLSERWLTLDRAEQHALGEVLLDEGVDDDDRDERQRDDRHLQGQRGDLLVPEVLADDVGAAAGHGHALGDVVVHDHLQR